MSARMPLSRPSEPTDASPARVLPMELSDLDAVMALVAREGWRGYSVQDLRLIMAVSPGDCFKLTQNGRLVGSIFALTVGRVSYLSFFLIEREYRSFALARRLGLACLSAVRTRAAAVVAYANRRAISAYGRVGFRPKHWVTRYRVTLTREGDGEAASGECLGPLSMADVVELDSRCYRQNRADLLQAIGGYDRVRTYGYRPRGETHLSGFAIVRGCEDSYIVGPVVATSGVVASKLVAGVLADIPGRSAIMELHDDRLLDWDPRLLDWGPRTLTYERMGVSVLKMYLGDETALEEDRLLYAIGGHHFS